ncbi:SIN3-associated polypeptide 30 [Brevipalpus obovatus]|uniref:SIN3-associated polypeptide 30 n=1 Tax=Brevipalpus obovatus TaxID=246614 RepID=UPI003D9F56A8
MMMSDFASSGSAFIDHHPSANQMCCLTEDGVRCSRIAGNASYSKRIQKTVQQKKLRLMIDNTARHVYICDHHKNLIQRERTCSVKKKRKDSCEDENGTNSSDLCGSDDYPTVDLSTLQMNTLRRFKRNYKVQTKPGVNKSQLADSLYDQFRKIQVDEKEIITYFIYMVKCNSNKLDQMKGLVTNNVK